MSSRSPSLRSLGAGGPGSGTTPKMRQFFDPAVGVACVFVDQLQSGRRQQTVHCGASAVTWRACQGAVLFRWLRCHAITLRRP